MVLPRRRKSVGRNAQDLTGKQFGDWFVVSRRPNRTSGNCVWLCRCSCGRELDVLGTNLTRGLTSRCNKCRTAVEDLTGRLFGEYTVLERGPDRGGVPSWLCRCSCGSEFEVLGANLRSGHSQNCRNCKFMDLTGQRFGRLTAVRRVGKTANCQSLWACRCDCDPQVEKTINASCLRSGGTQSCGCLQRETAGLHSRTHGLSGTPVFNMFNGAKTRAKRKNLPFSITLDDIVIPDVCPLLGVELITSAGKWSPNSPTLDRVKPALGYVPGNIQVISARANLSKNDLSFEEFEKIYKGWKRMRTKQTVL